MQLITDHCQMSFSPQIQLSRTLVRREIKKEKCNKESF